MIDNNKRKAAAISQSDENEGSAKKPNLNNPDPSSSQAQGEEKKEEVKLDTNAVGGVDVDGERDLVILWENARNFVATTYGRLKLLRQWVNDSEKRHYASYEELAEKLDETCTASKSSKNYRKRPDFAQGIIKHFDQTWRGSRHRRHIVMSSTMREAVYGVTDSNDAVQVLATYNKLIKMVGLTECTDLKAAETQLVYVLHNNPANLVLDTGSWNSAIGMLANTLRNVLKQDKDELWKQYQKGKDGFLKEQAKGFQKGIQENIINFWIDYAKENPPKDGDDLKELLFDMYDNAAFDILSRESLGNKALMATLMQCYTSFENVQITKKLEDLQKVCEDFITLGLTSKPSYKEVLGLHS